MVEQDVPEIGSVPTGSETFCDLGRHDRCDGYDPNEIWCPCPCHD